MSQTPGESRQLVPPFQKSTPAIQGSYEQMPPTNSKPIFPFIKSGSPRVEQSVDHTANPDDPDLGVADPKDESAAASAASLESQHPSEPIESETPVQTVPLSPIKNPAIQLNEVAETEITQDKDNENSSPSSFSDQNHGWNVPPVPTAPQPTSVETPTP